jgi:transposase
MGQTELRNDGVLTAAPVSIDPYVVVSRHETIFEGSQIEGALSRRRWQAHGKPREEVARTFSVSMPTIKRWLKRRRETGDVQPEPIPGRPPKKGAMLKEWLPKHLQANDDLTLEEHRQAFEEEFGEAVSTSTVGRAIAGLPQGGWPLKKSHT